MFESIVATVADLLGQGSETSNVNSLEMALRSILIYLVMVALVRLGSKRFLAEATAFDTIVAIIIGSVMSRAINGSAPMIPTIVAGAILLTIHWLFSFLAFRTDWFGNIVKGNPVKLIEDGEIKPAAMRRAKITPHDLEQALRMQLNSTDPSRVASATLERNGKISFITDEREPRVVDVSVEDGVQTVRVVID